MDPNQARSIRTKKRLQGQLNFDDNELDGTLLPIFCNVS